MNDTDQLTNLWARALDANLRYASLLSELAMRSLNVLMSAVSEMGPQIITTTVTPQEAPSVPALPSATPPAPAPAAMVLEGEAGSRAFGLFVVENKLPKEVTTRVAVGPLVDPEGNEIQSVLRFEPGVITLAPGEQVIAKVSAEISPDLVADVRYQGEISVPGIPGARIPIVVRRKESEKAVPSGGKVRQPAKKKARSGGRSPRAQKS